MGGRVWAVAGIRGSGRGGPVAQMRAAVVCPDGLSSAWCARLSGVVGGMRDGARDGSALGSGLAGLVAQACSGGLPELSGGRNNLLYTAMSADAGAVVVKLYRSVERADREIEALRFLEGSDVVPRLLHVQRDPVAAVVMSGLAGSPLAEMELTSQQVDALAESLARVYQLTPPPDCQEVATPPRRMVERVRQAVRAGDQPPEVSALWDRWEHGPGPDLLASPSGLVFGRGDPNLANCLWDGRRVGLVDWEYAGLSDVAYELADLIEHPASRATPDRSWMALVDRFALPPRERARLRAARGLLAVFWLARLPPGNPRWRSMARRAVGVVGER